MPERCLSVASQLLDENFVSQWSDYRPERILSLRKQDLKLGLHLCLMSTRFVGEARRRNAEHFRITNEPFRHIVDDVRGIEDTFVLAETMPNPDQNDSIPGAAISRFLPLSYFGILPDLGSGMYQQNLYAVSYKSVLTLPELVLNT